MFRKILMCVFCLIVFCGCDVPYALLAYPLSVANNWLAGAWQGGLADPQGLIQGALVNGFWNLTGLVPPP